MATVNVLSAERTIALLAGKADSVQPINVQTGTTYAASASDVGKLVTLSNAGAVTVVLPSDTVADIPLGARIDFASIGSGLTSFDGGGTATVNPASPTLRAQWSAATAVKLASNTWLVIGDLA